MDCKPSDDQDVSETLPQNRVINYRTILLSDIDSENQTFRITTRSDSEDLLISIRRVGLTQPPLLMTDSAGYTIVCGFRRIDACRSLGWRRVFAGILAKTVDRFKAAQFSIADNASQRSLNLVETSRALKLLDKFSPDDQQRRDAGQALGLPTNNSVAQQIKKICRLPLAVQEGILANTINLAMALELGRLDPGCAKELSWLFKELKLGLNKQRELLFLIKEIAERENTSIPLVIAEKALQEILKNEEMDRAVRRQKVRKYLRQRRFPAFSRAESNFRKWVGQLKLGNNIDMIPPRNFEGETFSMVLRFSNRKELDDLKTKIEQIIQHPALGKIFDE